MPPEFLLCVRCDVERLPSAPVCLTDLACLPNALAVPTLTWDDSGSPGVSVLTWDVCRQPPAIGAVCPDWACLPDKPAASALTGDRFPLSPCGLPSLGMFCSVPGGVDSGAARLLVTRCIFSSGVTLFPSCCMHCHERSVLPPQGACCDPKCWHRPPGGRERRLKDEPVQAPGCSSSPPAPRMRALLAFPALLLGAAARLRP